MSTNNFAQSNQRDTESTEKFKQQIGLAAGFTTGYGFSYRYWPGKLGVQITTLPKFEEGRADVNIGFTPLIELKEVKLNGYYVGKWYLYASANYMLDETGSRWNELTQESESYKYEAINAGAGVGFDIYVGNRIGFNGMAGYGFYEINKSITTDLTAEIGIYYKW